MRVRQGATADRWRDGWLRLTTVVDVNLAVVRAVLVRSSRCAVLEIFLILDGVAVRCVLRNDGDDDEKWKETPPLEGGGLLEHASIIVMNHDGVIGAVRPRARHYS